MGLAGFYARLAFGTRHMAAGARIDRAIRTMRCFYGAGDFVGDFLAGAKAWIQQSSTVELVQCCAIGPSAIGLAQHRLPPAQAQPVQIFENRSDEFLAAPCCVDVFDTEQESLPGIVRRDGRERMAQMQQAGWTRCKTRDNHLPRLHERAAMIIRPAATEDGPAVAAVRVVSWRAAYRGIVPDSLLATMNSNEAHWCKIAAGAEPGTRMLVCEEVGRVAGFACYGTARPPHFELSGELYATYFLPKMIGKGYGAAIMLEAMAGLKGLGHDDMMLWVIENNVRARRFYERLGGVQIANSRQSFKLDGTAIWEVAYGFRPLPVGAAKL
jgi:ribosomal protein S18 acetylase RimI-like enzyme